MCWHLKLTDDPNPPIDGEEERHEKCSGDQKIQATNSKTHKYISQR